jgi:hypothetical protein
MIVFSLYLLHIQFFKAQRFSFAHKNIVILLQIQPGKIENDAIFCLTN